MDRDAYFRRIGYDGGTEPSIDTLRKVHFAHRCTIPFENLDIHMGVPISLDIEHLAEKLVTRRRGGYCFEHNTLMLHLLRELGFAVTAREARVGRTDGPATRRTHMTLEVQVEDAAYNVDVGFGAGAHLYPLPLDGEVHEEHGRLFRVIRKGKIRVVQSFQNGTWTDEYAIQDSEPAPVDFDVANWYTSTHPDSIFRRTPTVQIQSPEDRFTLRRRTYVQERGGTEHQQELTDAEIPSLLAEVFGIELGPDVSRINFDGWTP